MLAVVLGTAQAQEKANIVFIRDTGYFGWAVDFREFVDGKIVCKIDNKSYNTIELEPGKHSITWQPNGNTLKKAGKKIAVDVELEAGKTYYFEMGIVQKFTKYELRLDELQETTARKKMASLKEDTNCFK